VQNTGVTTATAVGVDGATVYAGIVQVPYYLSNSGGSPQSTAPLTKYWLADATQPDIGASFPIGNVPCGAFATGATINGQTAQPSVSTTVCYPVPVKQSTETIPLIVAVPDAASGQTMPANGWPVVIFQHGITGNRTQMLAIAPALAKAGFVTVAIDLPLHGLTDPTNPFYRNQLFTGTPAAGLVTGERTFDLDLENNTTGAPGPDGVIDGSGAYFINLSSLLTARDNLREAEADLLTLTKSIANLKLSTDGSVKVDPTQIRFAALSLGSIVGVPYLANVSGTAVGAATLAVPGGGIAKLLDASKTFGPIVAAGLAAAGVKEGTDDYETFLRFAQTVTDDGDPLNYTAPAVAAHPIHLIEVIGDTVVPNNSLASPGTASEDLVTVGSNLGGTDPLIATMGLTVIGPINVPLAAVSKTINPAGVHAAVKFNQGSHGSLLDPTASPAATVEMQTETANFLGSNGVCLPIGGGC
jgi:hypothetical protein